MTFNKPAAKILHLDNQVVVLLNGQVHRHLVHSGMFEYVIQQFTNRLENEDSLILWELQRQISTIDFDGQPLLPHFRSQPDEGCIESEFIETGRAELADEGPCIGQGLVQESIRLLDQLYERFLIGNRLTLI